jgi:galactoside 2-L-fucosyltransferase 1/2
MDETTSERYDLDSALLTIPPNTDIQGYYLSWKYQCNVWDELQTELRLNRDLALSESVIRQTAKAKFVADGTATTTSPLIAVHVRRGDILKQQGTFGTPPIEYIHQAMDIFIERFTDPIFIVCSGGAHTRELSDVDWCEHNIKRPNVYFSRDADGEGRSAIHDFALMAGCDHAVLTSGTFGWWVGWLTGGDVIAWKNWEMQWTYKGHDHDFYPPTWTLLD